MMVLPIVRLVYSLFFVLVLPIIFCRLLYKSRRIPAYRQRWAERLGFVSFIADKNKPLKPIWVHVASMGEFLSAIPLVKALQKRYPNTPILITTMTASGSEQVQKYFKDELNKTIFHSYVPYDISWVINRFLNRLKPIGLIVLETELWPNLLCMAYEKNIPACLVNARLSPKSVKSYQYLGNIIITVLNTFKFVAAQSELDAKRYASLGTNKNKIINTGNIKYDLKIPEDLAEQGLRLRQRWDKTENQRRPVWIAASTHADEEKTVLSVFLNLQKNYPDLLLLLVPRHPDRFETVYQLCLSHHLITERMTDNITNINNINVFLGNTMGDMMKYYAASDIVFLGGSLAPVGGHNFLEPAVLGLPIVTGPHLFNFTEMSEILVQAGALKVINTAQELDNQIKAYLDNPIDAKQQGEAAKQVAEQNRGALNRVLGLIEGALG